MNNERLMVMRNKIENVGLEDCGVDGGLVAEIIDELIDSRYKIESLTAERDEARKELAELRNAPGVEEIDALENEYLFTLKTLGHLGSLADRYSLRDIAVKLADIARRSIASRDEVVGLLKWVNVVGNISDLIREYAESHFDTLDRTNAKRFLEIVEGE